MDSSDLYYSGYQQENFGCLRTSISLQAAQSSMRKSGMRNLFSTAAAYKWSSLQSCKPSIGSSNLRQQDNRQYTPTDLYNVTAKCRKNLNKFSTKCNTAMVWTPGYSDISGNCITDELASTRRWFFSVHGEVFAKTVLCQGSRLKMTKRDRLRSDQTAMTDD